MHVFTSPQLQPSTAHLLSLAFSIIYVGSIYVSSRARLSFRACVAEDAATTTITAGSSESTTSLATVSSTASNSTTSSHQPPRVKLKNERWRDDPDVIKARLLAVFIATLTCCFIIYILLYHIIWPQNISILDVPARLGFISNFPPNTSLSVWEIARPHLVTPVLYLGPLYAVFLFRAFPGQRWWSWEMNVRRSLFTWQGVRNVFVAPATEEIVFRGCMLSILHLAGVSRFKLLVLSPLYFGLAHVHHAWDTFNRYGRTKQAAMRAFTVTLFQLGYTTLFGCFTSFLFLRTSSIYPAISAHMFCNFMGFPRMGYEISVFPHRKKQIIVVYLIGVAGFIYVLPHWTFTRDSHYWVNYTEGRSGNNY